MSIWGMCFGNCVNLLYFALGNVGVNKHLCDRVTVRSLATCPVPLIDGWMKSLCSSSGGRSGAVRRVCRRRGRRGGSQPLRPSGEERLPRGGFSAAAAAEGYTAKPLRRPASHSDRVFIGKFHSIFETSPLIGRRGPAIFYTLCSHARLAAQDLQCVKPRRYVNDAAHERTDAS
ncbi:unnamed protein product [Merluccius merluccius]